MDDQHDEGMAGGTATGVPAEGKGDHTTFSPTGGPGLRHWREATVSRPGLEDRGDVFFAAVEMTRMPMILTDPRQPDNPIVFSNHAFSDLTGYEKEDIVGRNCRFLQGPETDREKVGELRDAIADRRAIAVEILNYKRDGTPFWNAVFVAPVFGPDEELLYFFASQLDVTRRRTSEQAYRQSQKMEAVGQLTAGLAHDFNNLLQVVSGNLEILRGKLRDDGLHRYLDAAAQAADRGSRLTRQLLAFARKTRLEPKAVDLSALVNEFGDMLDSAVGGKVDLRLSLGRRLPPTLLDPTHLEMALLNVVINARDAMPNGGSLTVSTSKMHLNGNAPAHHLPPGDYVCLEVADEGTGMPPHVIERATEPFFTTKPTGKGTGLGLAMAHGFLQQSLGRLEIDSEMGKGTTIRMVFPVAKANPEAATSRRREEASDLHMPLGRGESILLVEDSEDVLVLAREHLTALGYEVTEARNADEALAVLEGGRRFELLFTDLIMPGGMNGLALADRAKAMRPGLPVLLTTGYNEDLVAHGPPAGGMDLIGKPYRRADLAGRVRAAIDRRSGAAAVPRTHEGPRHEG